jgi:UDP-glucose 4-epimerase
MKTLVTGGSGFIGRYVVEALQEKGFDPLVLDPHPTGGNEGVEVFLGDIRDPVAVTEAMAHSEAWIHLGGVLGTAETIFNPRPAAETNILGGLNVLEAASQYDLPGVNIAVGNYWMNNTYSITKNTVERFAEMFRDERGLQVSTVRALNAYGPRQSVAAPFGTSKVRKITPSFVCRALSGMPIEIYGDGNQIMDMIHVTDVADVLVAALQYTVDKGPVGSVIEAGSGVPTTVNDIANVVIEEVVEQTGRRAEIAYLPMRPGEPLSSIVLGDPTTVNKVIPGFEPKSLAEGMVDTVAYFQDYLDTL